MGTAMSSSPSSTSSNGSSLGSQGIGMGHGARKGVLSALFGGKRSTFGTTASRGSPSNESSVSPTDYAMWGDMSRSYVNYRRTPSSSEREEWRWSTGLNSASQYSYASTLTTPSSASGREPGLGRKQILSTSWNQTKRIAAGLFGPSTRSSRDSMCGFAKLSPTDGYNNNAQMRFGEEKVEKAVYLRPGRRNIPGKDSASSAISLSNKAKAVSKVREIFESAARNKHVGSLACEKGASKESSRLIQDASYCYNYTILPRDTTTEEVSKRRSKGEGRRLLPDAPEDKQGCSHRCSSQRNHIRSVRATAERVTRHLASMPRDATKSSLKDLVNNNNHSVVITSEPYSGLKKAKTPVSPTHSAHPFRVLMNGRGLTKSESTSSDYKRGRGKGHSPLAMSRSAFTEGASRPLHGTQCVVPPQRPLSWAAGCGDAPLGFDKKGVVGYPANKAPHRRKTIQASTSELLRALSNFIHIRSFALLSNFRAAADRGSNGRVVEHLSPAQIALWLRGVDRALILQGWADIAFINPANLVFLYMMLRDRFSLCLRRKELLADEEELHSLVLGCLYLSYSYIGNEISYPLKPFLRTITDRTQWWSTILDLINIHSDNMLRLNASSTFFFEVFAELKEYAEC